MLVSDFKMSGQVQIALNGVIVEEVDNLVVTAGKGYVADRMKNNSTVMSHMAVGTATTAAATNGAVPSSRTRRHRVGPAGRCPQRRHQGGGTIPKTP